VPPPENARQSAVALLLYPHQGEWYLPLTLRPATLSHHASQVSLPGGSLDAGESPETGAWRELAEELGIVRETFAPLGRLTPLYIFISNFFVIPCVAVAHERPAFRPSPSEVEAVLELPLTTLLSQTVQETMWIERGNLRFRAPCWHIAGQRVWGASAMILGELAKVLRDAGFRW
jgi:8-oxo-dGTP pyrophosphatase MutT (NUDIX family)